MYIIVLLKTADKLGTTVFLILPVLKLGLEKFISNSL